MARRLSDDEVRRTVQRMLEKGHTQFVEDVEARQVYEQHGVDYDDALVRLRVEMEAQRDRHAQEAASGKRQHRSLASYLFGRTRAR